jgi:predicted nuclease of predicted toxin-antitoxin system
MLVDAGVGSAGHDVACVRDRDPRMADSDVLSWAVAEQRLVVTMDKDFGELVFLSGQAHVGVLLLRFADADSAAKVAAVEAVVSTFGDQLAGHFSVYQNGQLRIR